MDSMKCELSSYARGPISKEIFDRMEKEVCFSIRRVIKIEDNTVLIDILKNGLAKAASILYSLSDVYLRTMAAVDERSINGVYALYYVFGVDKENLNIVLRIALPEDNPEITSIVGIVKAVDWYELEAHDMMGIKFIGRNLHRLILPDDWPDNVYPLRKDYTVEDLRGLYSPKAVEYAHELGAEQVVQIPLGPYHPALHEPEYFELYVRGEKVVDVRYVGFHVHRGIEKLAERMKYNQVPFIAERICGICGFVHSTAYCQAVEAALKIDVPERAHFIRSIVLEIERIHSHLLWLGVAFHLLGYDTGFMHTWRIREKVMWLAELLTGSRKTYGINIVGGVRRDINEEKKQKALEILSRVRDEFKELVDVALSVPQVKRRLEGTGILPRAEARAYSVVGPTARGSGLDRDVRKDYPYAAYRYATFKVPVYSEGDNLARTLVRIDEVFESISIIEQLLDKIPSGPIAVERFDIEPFRIAIGSVEAPRGENIHFVITGREGPYRWRVRAPTYQNIPALQVMLKGVDLADAAITIASIDPCFSCTDRALVIDLRRGDVYTIDLVSFLKKSIKRL